MAAGMTPAVMKMKLAVCNRSHCVNSAWYLPFSMIHEHASLPQTNGSTRMMWCIWPSKLRCNFTVSVNGIIERCSKSWRKRFLLCYNPFIVLCYSLRFRVCNVTTCPFPPVLPLPLPTPFLLFHPILPSLFPNLLGLPSSLPPPLLLTLQPSSTILFCSRRTSS